MSNFNTFKCVYREFVFTIQLSIGYKTKTNPARCVYNATVYNYQVFFELSDF